MNLIPLRDIDTPNQIRTRNGFDEATLNELAASIRSVGVLQPIIVSPASGGRYALIAGERRLLAASMAGLEDIPAMIHADSPARTAAAQAIENLQRVDLHPADIGEGLHALRLAYHGSWKAVAKAIGKSPAWVSKHQALHNLHPISAAVLAEGHTTDPDMICTLNTIEAARPHLAASLADLIARGECTREKMRLAAAAVRAGLDLAADAEAHASDAEPGPAATGTQKAPPLPRLTPEIALYLAEHITQLPHARERDDLQQLLDYYFAECQPNERDLLAGLED